jgi:hypothetical protein
VNVCSSGNKSIKCRGSDTSLPNDQGAVRFALEMDDWVCRKLAVISWAELDRAKLQHFVSTAENGISRDPFLRRRGPCTS